MSTEDDVRRLATALPEVSEKPSYGTPAFFVAGRIFARMHEMPEVLVCWVPDLDEKEALLAADPAVLFTTDHYRGHASVLVRLAEIEVDELAELLGAAWDARAPRRLRGTGTARERL
ncbi:MmcQ/YjbR family DNA-binding protein [Brachybacterium phenoliresistens]|uniref:MmcQ/YjbR family DNA-binding protein n=1 Tax=Brachybacterium phenoliresistens TaxID=396014 RepID=UPI0031D46EF1